MARRLPHVRLVPVSLCLLLLATLAASDLPASAKPRHPKLKDDYKRQVQHLEEDWRIAQLNNDLTTADKLLSDDYVGITMAGQVVTKAQQLDRMRTRRFVLTKIELDDLKIKLEGSTAIVTCLANVEGNNDGTPIHGMYRYTRVYTRLASGTWKITNFEATRVGSPGHGRDHNHREADGQPPLKPE